jgi:hypothetical protein
MLFVLKPHRSQPCETLRLNAAYPALKILTARNPTAFSYFEFQDKHMSICFHRAIYPVSCGIHLTIKTCAQIIGILYVDRL